MIEREGGCECGALRYTISGEPVGTAVCHCTQCQRQSGSAFGMSLVVQKADFRLSGEPRHFQIHADSGAEKLCVFCPTCGIRIYNEVSSRPDWFNVKPGTLDDTSWLQPVVHVWLASKQPWVPIPEGARTFEKNPGPKR